MRTVPEDQTGQLQFYSGHVPVWIANAAQIGLSPILLTDLDTKTSAAVAARDDMLEQRRILAASTARFHTALDAMNAQGGAVLAAIRGFARTSNNPEVYNIAQIPGPKPREPVAAPGQPYAPSVKLQVGGSLQLKWKCNNPADGPGVRYEIHRQDGTGPMTLLTTTGRRYYTDVTIPAGSANVTYTIVPVRSDKQGQAAQFAVQFGTTGGAGSAGAIGTANVRKAA
jgi:hypothetical protein